MVIQANRISLTLQESVSVPITKDGKVSHANVGVAMEGPGQRETGSGTSVYSEAEARQLNIEEELLSGCAQMSPADFISQCTTGEDAKALSDEETPLEEYTSSQLERAIQRVREERRDKSDAIECQVESEKEEAVLIEEAAQEAIEEQQLSSRVLEQMQQSGLPVTSENVVRISHALDMAAEIESFSDASMKFFVSQNLEITPENVCESVYSVQGEGIKAVANGEADFSEVEEQVKERLSENGEEPEENKLETAKWLYENDLPVTKETVQTCEQIEVLKNLDSDVREARILDGMADGVPPEKVNMMKISVAEAITVRRQLEETRLTMSIDAVRNMSAKGIDLDISHLEQIVEGLREQEEQAKAALWEETGLPEAEEAADLLFDTVQAAKQVLDAPVPFLGHMMESQETETLHSISNKAVTYTEEFAKVQQHYESVGTEVRRDLGDSMQKAFQNVDTILEDLDLPVTAQNQRAVRSLAYNQMPLTEENIFQMKEYDSRVTGLMKGLKPPVVAELIRQDINPLEISLEELSDYVREIQENLGVEDIPFAKYLWKLDRQKAISPEERETMIGLYRLLDKIEKSDGAVVGQLLKEGRELSLNALLSAVRTRRDAGMDVQIDDAFGERELSKTVGNSISEQIQTAYNQNVVKNLQKSLSPALLREYGEENITLEQLLEYQQSDEAEENEYYRQMAREWQEVMAGEQERMEQFLAELDMPETIANLRCVQEYMQQGNRAFSRFWQPEESEELLETFDEPEDLEEAYTQIEEKQKKRLAELRERDDIKYDDIQNMMRMNQRISFYGNLRRYQMYEVPIFMEQGVTTCHVTIQSGDNEKKGMVEIAMDSPELGKVQASFRVNGKHVNGFITVENRESVSRCQTYMENFEKDLEENGYAMDSGNLVTGNRDSLPVGNRAAGTKNQDLYRIAKMFIVTMNGKDDAA